VGVQEKVNIKAVSFDSTDVGFNTGWGGILNTVYRIMTSLQDVWLVMRPRFRFTKKN
jgi:hypothetical protein